MDFLNHFLWSSESRGDTKKWLKLKSDKLWRWNNLKGLTISELQEILYRSQRKSLETKDGLITCVQEGSADPITQTWGHELIVTLSNYGSSFFDRVSNKECALSSLSCQACDIWTWGTKTAMYFWHMDLEVINSCDLKSEIHGNCWFFFFAFFYTEKHRGNRCLKSCRKIWAIHDHVFSTLTWLYTYRNKTT